MYRFAFSILASIVLVAAPLSAAQAVNSAELNLTRIDDYLFPSDQFSLEIRVELDGAGVTGVSVTAAGGTLVLEEFPVGSGQWESADDVTYANFAALQTDTNGTWTIAITGSSPSTSTFTLNAGALTSGDLFPTATNLSPANGTTNVSTNPTLTWTDPTGIVTPYALALDLYSGVFVEEALSIPDLGIQDVAITATSWQPTGPLPNGLIEFGVFYADANLSVLTAIGALQVTAGSIVWGDSGFAPPGYPAATPLLILASESIVEFTVPEASTESTGAVALCMLLLLARSRPAGYLRS